MEGKTKGRKKEYIPENVKKFMEGINSYHLFIPMFVYFIGFVFVQGMIMPFTQNISLNLFDIIFQFMPVSFNFYILNGIVYTAVCCIAILLGFIFWPIARRLNMSFLVAYYKSKRKKGRGTKRSVKGIVLFLIEVFLTLLSFLFYFVYLLYIGYIKKPIFGEYFILILIGYNSLLFLAYRILYELAKVKIRIGVKENEKKEEIRIGNYFYILLAALTIAGHAFMQGFIVHMDKIALAEEEKGSYKLASIYTDKETPSTYLKIDISKDFFVGYDTKLERIVLTPMSQIKRIDIVGVKKTHPLVKYDKKIHDATLEKEKIKALATVERYYGYRLDKKKGHSEEWLELLSHQYYSKQLNMISPELLKKVWTSKNEINGVNINDLIGFEMSIPKEIKDNKENLAYNIYVIQYEKKKTSGIKYFLIKENDKWKIDSVIIDKNPFVFEY
ncbi:hypothetical protein [Aneurinibacillus tyrosinisolvens]|uniref:hypothetical protein n=1 Tax=Aneurinibacillus tyrosinisolvens TaxID=1443435 RepID=UPI00063F6C1A|nr:hypothetical protein [Aneurinibacillus tyrosinisolvens]